MGERTSGLVVSRPLGEWVGEMVNGCESCRMGERMSG